MVLTLNVGNTHITMGGYENDKLLGPTGAVAIPEFNTKFTRGMLMDTMPERFDTLLRRPL